MSAALMILAVALVVMLGMFIGREVVVAALARRVLELEHRADVFDQWFNEERDLSTARYHRLRKRIQRVERDVEEGKGRT